MKDMPLIFKLIINFILYVIYVLFVSAVFSFMFPIVLKMLGMGLIDYRDPLFEKIQIFIAVFVLLVSLIFRKYFYISNTGKRTTVYSGNLGEEKEVEQAVTQKVIKKIPEKKSISKKETPKIERDYDDDEIKIYVEKEIK